MNEKTMYIRVKNSNSEKGHRGDPVGCVSTRLVRKEGEDAGLYVVYSLSITSPNDEFKKSTARDITQGRLKSHLGETITHEQVGLFNLLNPNYALDYKNVAKSKMTYALPNPIPHDESAISITKMILNDIVNRKDIPNRFRNITKEWIENYSNRKKLN